MQPQFMPQVDLMPTQPCKIYHNTMTPDGIGSSALSLNYHVNEEILYCAGGEGQVMIRDQRYRMMPGDILIVHPGLLHQVLPPAQSFEIYCLILNNAFCRNLGIDLDTLEFECCFHDPELADSISGLSRLCGEYAAADQISAARLVSGFSALILSLLEHHLINGNRREKFSAAENTVKAAIGFIQAHFQEKITLDGISEALYVNKYYLCKIFHRHTGMSVIQYVNEFRLAQARMMLREGQKVSEVYGKCGFHDQSYFMRLYRKRYHENQKAGEIG